MKIIDLSVGGALAILSAAIPAQAATIGLTCGGVAQIVVAPTASEAGACVVASYGLCTIGFRVNGGYYAVATSADGFAQGASGGFREALSAEIRAKASCEATGAGDCTITLSAKDDGDARVNCE